MPEVWGVETKTADRRRQMMFPAWQDANEGERLAFVARITDDIFKQMKAFNNPAYGVREYNGVASIIYNAIDTSQHERSI